MDSYGDFYGVTYDGLIYNVVIPLTITLQPHDTIGIEGKPATFEVAAIAPAPITNSIFYQWQKDGVNLSDHGNISGATSNILKIRHVSHADKGTYAAVVSDSMNSLLSSNAALHIHGPSEAAVLLDGSASTDLPAAP